MLDDDSPFRDLPFFDPDASLAHLPPGLTRMSLSERCAGELAHLPRFAGLRALSLDRCDPGGLAPLRSLPALEALSITARRAPGAALLELVASLPSLRELELCAREAPTRDDLTRLAAAPRLGSLQLDMEHRAGEDALEALAAARGLRSLRVARLPVLSARGVSALAGLASLERLELDSPREVRPDAIAALASLTGLRALGMEAFKNVPDAAYAPLAGLTGLRSLSLRSASASGKVGPYVAALTGLRALSLGWSNIEGPALAHLTALTRVEWLDLSNAKAGPALEQLARAMPLRTLRGYSLRIGRWLDALVERGLVESLDLSSTGLSDAKLRALAKAPRLRELDLGSCKRLTAKGLRALGSFPALASVRLAHLDAPDDRAVEAIARLPALEELELVYTPNVTDAGLRALVGAPSLRRLNVHGLADARPDTLAAICAASPVEQLIVWGCAHVRGEAVARLRALRPAAYFGCEDWQRETRVLPCASRLDDAEENAVLGPGLRRSVSYAWAHATARELPGGAASVGPKVSTPHPDVFRACGTLFADGSPRVHVHALPGWRELCALPALAEGALGATASADGARVAVVGRSEVRVFAMPGGGEVLRVGVPWALRGAGFSPGGGRLVAYGERVRVVDVASGEALFERDVPAWAASLFEEGRIDVVTAARELTAWSLADGATLASWSPATPGGARCLQCGPGYLCRRREAPRDHEAADRVVRMARTADGEVRVLLDRNGFCAELWAGGEAVHVDTGTNAQRAELSDDGRALLLPALHMPPGNLLWDVDAVLAFARDLPPPRETGW